MNQNDTADIARSIAESAEQLLRSRSPLSRLRTVDGHAREFLWNEFAAAGWTSLLVPEDCGGLGLGIRSASALAEAIGRNPIPEPLTAVAVQSVKALCCCPPGATRDQLLKGVAAGEVRPALAWQEQLEEMSLATGTMSLRHETGRIVLNGSKSWIVPATDATGWIVGVSDGAGDWLVWAPNSTSGIATNPLPRIDGSPMCSLELRDVRIPAENVLARGADASKAVRDANDLARVVQAAELLGVARQVFQITLDYLKSRVQFGKVIGANQVLQHRMVDVALNIEVAAAGFGQALEDYDRGVRSLAETASRVKARCAQVAVEATRRAVQYHGAIGFTDECDVGLYLKRALHLTSWLGGPRVHLLRHFELTGRDESRTALDDDAGHPEAVRSGDWNAMSDEHFRRMVRGFLIRNYPPHLRHPPQRLHWNEAKEWYLTLSRQGWIAPGWPAEHGGMDLPPEKLLAFIEEMEAHGAARLPDQGLINLGPILIRFGTPQQKQYYLPRIISGEHVWCQGYSEPNAGSDLASLRTEARLEGDHFIVNGQKIWTTLAQDATHIFMLVRTDKGLKKQEGISFLIADLHTPGVTVRPIVNIAGEEEFCEVFFDEVRVPRTHLVGELHQGWGIAKALLGFERLFVGSPKTCQYALSQLRALAIGRGIVDSPAFIQEFARLHLDVIDLGAMYASFTEIIKRGGVLPESVSLLKIWASETYQRIAYQVYEFAADQGATRAECSFGAQRVDPLVSLLNSTVTTIYGGTSEIQRNILAKRLLGLPT